jgi:hypothetical protein
MMRKLRKDRNPRAIVQRADDGPAVSADHRILQAAGARCHANTEAIVATEQEGGAGLHDGFQKQGYAIKASQPERVLSWMIMPLSMLPTKNEAMAMAKGNACAKSRWAIGPAKHRDRAGKVGGGLVTEAEQPRHCASAHLKVTH